MAADKPSSLASLPPHGTAMYYRFRFESSVLGQHQPLPPPEIAGRIRSRETPPSYPRGPNTSFQFPTPMPHRFASGALPEVNIHHTKKGKEHPIYATSASVIGALPMEPTDLPMRWYGLEGQFTEWSSVGGEALPKTKVNFGLNSALDRSDIHHSYDQGWSGNLGLTGYNIANRRYARFSVDKARAASR